MTKEAKTSAMLDLKAFGQKFYFMRKSRGIKNLDAFSEVIFKTTEESISPKTLYRIEHGETVITLPQLVAIVFTLTREIFPYSLNDVIVESAYPKWQTLEKKYREQRQREIDEIVREYEKTHPDLDDAMELF